MRLREIEKIINENIQQLAIPLSVKIEPNAHTIVEDYNSYIQAIINIEKTNLINPFIKELDEHDLFLSTSATRIRFEGKNITYLKDFSKRLISYCEGISTVLNHSFHGKRESEYSVVVSLPDKEINYNQITNIHEKLDEVFKLLNFHKEFDEDNITFKNFDIGTNWEVISLSSVAAVTFFGNIVTICLFIQQRIKSNKILDKELESINIENKIKQRYLETNQEINSKIYRDYAEKLVKGEDDIENAPETITNLAMAFQKMNELNELGVSFESSINASKEIANTFPPLIEQKSKSTLDLLTQVDRIESNQSDSDNKDKE